MAVTKSPFLGVVYGCFPWVSWGYPGGTAYGHSRSASPNPALGTAWVCFFDGHDHHVISRDSQSDWATSVANSTYGRHVLFLVGIHVRICDPGAVELDLFWADGVGDLGHGDSVMAATQTNTRGGTLKTRFTSNLLISNLRLSISAHALLERVQQHRTGYRRAVGGGRIFVLDDRELGVEVNHNKGDRGLEIVLPRH
jgi:hypothetical protein